MKNAHLRFGWLTYVKSTEKTTTSIKLRLDRFIGEVLPDPPRQAKAHLISVIGGDTQVAEVSAAISLAARGRCGFCCEQDEDVGTQNEGVESRHRCTFLFCADQKRDPELQENQQVVRGVALPATRCSFPE